MQKQAVEELQKIDGDLYHFVKICAGWGNVTFGGSVGGSNMGNTPPQKVEGGPAEKSTNSNG